MKIKLIDALAKLKELRKKAAEFERYELCNNLRPNFKVTEFGSFLPASSKRGSPEHMHYMNAHRKMYSAIEQHNLATDIEVHDSVFSEYKPDEE